jgi:hypothetical protein
LGGASKGKTALIKQKTQAGFINGFSRNSWQALTKALVLLLVFSHQVWAGHICHCNSQTGAHHAGFHAAQHPTSMASVQREDLRIHSSHHCAEEEKPAIADKEKAVTGKHFDQLPQSVIACCQGSSQLEVAAVSVSPPSQTPLINVLPPTNVGAQTNLTPAPFTIHPLHPSRPLYLSFSCLLI